MPLICQYPVSTNSKTPNFGLGFVPWLMMSLVFGVVDIGHWQNFLDLLNVPYLKCYHNVTTVPMFYCNFETGWRLQAEKIVRKKWPRFFVSPFLVCWLKVKLRLMSQFIYRAQLFSAEIVIKTMFWFQLRIRWSCDYSSTYGPYYLDNVIVWGHTQSPSH